MTFLRRTAAIGTCVAALALPATMHAQNADTLLARATVALNDLNYDRALLLARQLLTIPTLNQAQRVSALQLVSAAFYPEEDDKRHADSAMTVLRDLVRADPAAKMPRDITWRGLDSLLEVARTTTYIAGAKPESEYSLVGPEGGAVVPVTANRPSVFRLALVSPTGATIVRDSSGPATSAQLRFRALDGNQALFQTGAHRLVLSAVDPRTGDSLVTRYAVRVDAPPLTLEPLPAAFDRSVLRPERFPPARSRAYAAGVLLAGATIGMAVAGRAEEPVRSAFSLDVKAIAAAVGLAGGALWAARSDKGGPLPVNVAYNEGLKREYDARVAAVNAENQRRIAAYRAQFSITGEER